MANPAVVTGYEDANLEGLARVARAVDGLANVFDDVPVHMVGDCIAPGDAMIAIHEGHDLGNRL